MLSSLKILSVYLHQEHEILLSTGINLIQKANQFSLEIEIIKHHTSHATDRLCPIPGLISAARKYEDFHPALDARVKLLDKKLVGRWN